MNRRNFLRSLIVGGVATAAAVRTFPFRVFSFPSEVKPLSAEQLYRLFDQKLHGVPYSDLLYVSVDGGSLPLHGLPYYIGDEDHPVTTGTMFGIPRTVCKSVDPVNKIITWES